MIQTPVESAIKRTRLSPSLRRLFYSLYRYQQDYTSVQTSRRSIERAGFINNVLSRMKKKKKGKRKKKGRKDGRTRNNSESIAAASNRYLANRYNLPARYIAKIVQRQSRPFSKVGKNWRYSESTYGQREREGESISVFRGKKRITWTRGQLTRK